MVPSKSFLGRNPQYRRLLIASTISLLGTGIFDIAIPLYVLQKTHSVIDLALVSISLHLPYFLMAPFTGYLVDHFDKRRIMIFADLGQIVCLVALWAYESSSSHSIVPVLLTVFTAKSLMIFFETVATFQLIPALVRSEDLARGNSWFLACNRIVQVVGPFLGGVLLTVGGIKTCIAVNLVSFVATLFFSYRLREMNRLIVGSEDQSAGDIRLRGIYREFLDSLRFVVRSPVFRPFTVLMFFWNLSSIVPNTATMTYYFTEVQKFTPVQYGVMVSMVGLFSIIAYLRGHSLFDRFGLERSIIYSALWQAVFGVLLVFCFPFPILLGVLFAVSRMGSAVLTMGTFVLRQTLIPREKTGGVNSCIRMLFMVGAVLSALLQAFLIKHLGVHVSLAIGALFLWLTYRQTRVVSEAYQKTGRFEKEVAVAA